MRQFLGSDWLACAVLVALAPASLVAQNSFTEIDASDVIVHEALPFSQKQGKVGTSGLDGRYAFVFGNALGNDVGLRILDHDLAPVTGDIKVNETLDVHVQDEPSVAMDENGNIFVAWSDRAAYDGSIMGIFARVYDNDGVPLTPEFVVNQTTEQSQWEPLVHANPGGGFVVAWSGNADGDAYIRVYDTVGAPVSDEFEVNIDDNNAQIDTAAAIGAADTMLAVWVDFGGNGPGSGTNIFGRMLDTQGVPLGTTDFLIHDTIFEGAQRSPAVDADGLGNFVVVWDDLSGNDGDGDGCYARRFDSLGNALTPEILVNETTLGNQFTPQVATDWVGNFLVTWEDDSPGVHRVMARRFDKDGLALGGEFQVASNTVDDKAQPHVVCDHPGESFLFVWNGTGVGTAGDVLAKRYRFDPIEVGPVSIGSPIELALDLPGGDGLPYVMVGSFQTSPGLGLSDGRELELVPDLLFNLTLAIPNNGVVFTNFQGLLDNQGRSSATILLPNNPNIVGVTMYYATVSVAAEPAANGSILRHVTRSVAITIP